jgi:Tfp pilus assembly protein FimT
MNQKGVSFVELCIVISLLGLFYLTVTPLMIGTLQKQQTNLFVRQLSSDLYLASAEAAAKLTTAEIQLSRVNGFYIFRLIGGQKGRKVDLPPGHQIHSNFRNDRVTFYQNGQIAQGGTIFIKDPDGRYTKIVLQLSSGRFYISYE